MGFFRYFLSLSFVKNMRTASCHTQKGTSMKDIDVLWSALEEAHSKLKGDVSGEVASYIPALAKGGANSFGIAITDLQGKSYKIGDSDLPFSIQSISKVLTYGLALHDHGRDYIRARVGVEPTGDAFNSIIKLDSNNKPPNPMTNAGAIAITDMIKGETQDEKLSIILDAYKSILGQNPKIDMEVYQSEFDTGHRNRAIAHLLRHFGIMGKDANDALDLYFKQCSILTSATEISVIAATLANEGVSPLTNKRVIQKKYVRDILSVMFSCGLYDGAGEWAFEVGMPAKSGVSGGILAVVPGKCGIGIFSPPLDARGNSVRGIKACEILSKRLGWHVLECG